MPKDGIKEEEIHLKQTLVQYKEIMAETEERMKAMPSIYRDNPDLLLELMVSANNQIVYLKRGLLKPYFARIDFTDAQTDNQDKYYIGKLGVSDLDDNIVTVDWRAPISTLYYDSNIGPVSYEAPQGEVTGTLDAKRQLEVEDGVLQAVRDVDTVANDDLLKPYLGVNADNRLKNIVASIQGEQNKIIREKLNKNIIVQGSAGSGKTTVALHRIAYLVYNNRNSIKPEQYMILGPNQFFINYISAILPDLDVNSVPETTFEGFAREFLQEPFHLASTSAQLIQAIQGENQNGVEYLKSSLDYKKALDSFLLDFAKTVVPQDDFLIQGFFLFSREEIAAAYDALEDEFYTTIQSKVNKCINQFSAAILNNLESISQRLSAFYRDKYERAEQDSIAALHKQRAGIQQELEQGCRNRLKKYFAAVDIKIMKIYKLFLEGCANSNGGLEGIIRPSPGSSQLQMPTDGQAKGYLSAGFAAAERLVSDSLRRLKKREVTFEDLPALIYLKERLKGAESYKKYRHAVIDEAQDFGSFHFYALRKIMSSCTFTIVGDLAQSIYHYRSIKTWEDVISDSFDGEASLLEMSKSYRTTVEIMEAANKVTAEIGLSPAKPVIRHGDPVTCTRVAPKELVAKICTLSKKHRQDGFHSVAILCKTAEEAKALNESLNKLGLDVVNITSSSEQYSGGLCTMTGYLSKGLEFDCVIIADASTACYSPENRLDMHLLYVAMTRPLHRLDIFSTGEITRPLMG